MHPAFSVIFFTTASGAGYGMLVVLAIIFGFDLLPVDQNVGIAGLGLSFLLVTSGLLSSMFHLGHPERAWRAMTQWRSSWLSREGVLSVVTYGPWALLAYVWLLDGPGQLGLPSAFACAVLAIGTIYCTAMIYRSLATVHQWYNGWTVVLYIALGLMSGAVWVGLILAITGIITGAYMAFCLVALLIGWRVQRHYWNFIDTTKHHITPQMATGLKGESIRLMEGPHTEENYLLQEMGFKIARKHAEKLRRLVHIFGFGVPLGFIFAGYLIGGPVAFAATFVAALSMSFGMVVSRWLFFAEAKHVVTLYYGAQAA